jgi:hypothetical protein
MSTSQLGAVVDAIRAGLAALPGLADVNVFSGVVPVEEAGLECIAFGDGRLEEVAASMGGNREETWVIGGELRVLKTWQGDTESTIKAARDRGLEIFAQVETYLNDTYVGSLPDVQLTSADIYSTFVAEGREFRLAFELTIENIKTP